jgi:hypothetical protein
MSSKAMQIANLIDMLPDTEQDLAVSILNRLIKAWDPDYTKLTPSEKKELEQAENDEYFSEEEIEWDNLEKYAK